MVKNYLLCLINIFVLSFSSINAQNLSLDWYFGINPSALDVSVEDVESDAADNIYICGHFYGSVDLDPSQASAIISNESNMTSNQNNGDVFLVSYNSSGQLRWYKTFGGPGNETSNSLAVTPSGFVAWLFSTGNSITLDPSIPQSELTFFSGGQVLVWLEPNYGNLHSFYPFNGGSIVGGSGGGYDSVENVKFDNSANTIAVGASNDSNYMMRVYSWSSNLQLNWNRLIKTRTTDICTDVFGNVYLAARVYGSGFFLQDTFEAYYNADPTYGDVLIVKLNASGQYQWSGLIGGSGSESGLAIECDGSGKLFVTFGVLGNYEIDLFATGPTYFNFDGHDSVLCSYDLNGQLIWSDHFGDDAGNNPIPNDLKFDPITEVVYVNQFLEYLDGDPSTGTAFDGASIWAYNSSDGSLAVWGSGFNTENGNIATVSDGGLYFLAEVQGGQSADIKPGSSETLVSAGPVWDGFFLVNYNVTACTANYSNVNVSICSGSTYAYHGSEYPIGEHTVYLTNFGGCDSIVTLTVTNGNNPTYLSHDIVTCDSFTYQGQLISNEGTYSFDWVSQGGCLDSVVTLYVSLPSPQNIYHSGYFCEPFIYQNQTISTTGSYSFDWISQSGCVDSTVNWSATFVQVPGTLQFAAALGNYTMYNSGILLSGSYIFRNCDNNEVVQSGTSPTFSTNLTGNYSVQFVPNSSYNFIGSCDFTTDCVYVGPTAIAENQNPIPQIYPNPMRAGENQIFSITDLKPNYVKLFAQDGRFVESLIKKENNWAIQTPLSPGIYILHIESDNFWFTQKLIME